MSNVPLNAAPAPTPPLRSRVGTPLQSGPATRPDFGFRAGRFGAAALIALMLCVAGGGTNSASAAPLSVDPTTLNPAPPAAFNATCTKNGSNIICDLHFTEMPMDNEPNGVVCDSASGPVDILETSTRSVVGKRYYDIDGNLLRRHFHDEVAGTLANPATGKSVTYLATNRTLHDLAVPGDNTSGSEEITSRMRVLTADGSTVFVDAGRTVIAEADGTIEFQAGKHRFDDYFVNGDTAALAPLCEALG